MNDDTRTSAVGLFNYAHSYAASAVQLSKYPPIDTTHPEAVTGFLAFHAIELYLKAFLRAKGQTLGDLKSIGHRLDKLRDKASELGLVVKDPDGVIDLAADTMMDRRYIRTGHKQRHRDETVFVVCRNLHQATGAALEEAGLAKRLPPVESLA